MAGVNTRKCCCGPGTDGNCTCPFSACPNTDVSMECSRCCNLSHFGTIVNRTPGAYHVVVTDLQICAGRSFGLNCGAAANSTVRVASSTWSGSFNVTPWAACQYQAIVDAIDYVALETSDGAGGWVPFTDRRLKLSVDYNLGPGSTGAESLSGNLSYSPFFPGASCNGATLFDFGMTNPSCCNLPNASTSNLRTGCSGSPNFDNFGYGGSATVEECAA